jgi:hypothetical protein
MKLSIVLESVIDYPQPTLSPIVWDLSVSESSPTLKSENKEKIFKLIKLYPKLDLISLIKEIRIVGSICSNQYVSGSDVDVHLIVDIDKLKEIINSSEQFIEINDIVKDLAHFSHYTDFASQAMIGEHPIELYLQTNPQQDFMSEGLYDVMKDEWKLGPKITKFEYDPYEYYSHLFNEIQEINKEFDLGVGELKRDVIDYDFIKNAISNIKPQYQQRLKEKLQSKLNEIESDILLLMKQKKKIVDQRHNSSRTSSTDKEYEKINVIFKFIDRYQYFKLIRHLEELMKDKIIDNSDVSEIKKVLI